MVESEGRFSDALIARLDDQAGKLEAAASAWDEFAAILRQHAEAMEAIAADARRARSQIADAESDLRVARRAALASSPADDSYGMSAPRASVFDGDLTYLYRWQAAQEDIAAYKRNLDEIARCRDDLDRSTSQRLSSIGLVNEIGSLAGGSTAVGVAAWLGDLSSITAEELGAVTDPEVVASIWSQLTPEQQTALLLSGAAILGSLAGLPAMVRAAANRINAENRVKEIDAELARIRARGYSYDSDQPYAEEAAAADYLTRIRELEAERGYLERAARGEILLYAYEPKNGTIIEMIGNPDEAAVIMSFMPGTNTTAESFYSSSASEGITALTRWQVEHAGRDVPVAGFVVKQGDFPQLGGNIFATGPQNNGMAHVLGERYARFTNELAVISPSAALVSVEHSFGSAVAGVAENSTTFDARILLSGIGMTSDWSPKDGTDYYAMQAPNDVNRHLDGAQAWGWGYGVTPSAENGITELNSGIDGTPLWAQIAMPVSPTVGLVADAVSGLDHHNQIISADITQNETVMREIQQLLIAEAK
jgi:hypothetical protein